MSNTIVRQLHDHDRSTMTATKILTIAAVPEFRTAVASILDGDGYATATAGTGAEGLRSATSVMPDVVIVDSRLPDMTLGELCLRLRSVTMARIVALTRPESNDERLVAMAAGVDRCLNKPFTTDQLLEIIEDGAPNATTDTMENPQQVGRLRIDRLGREVHWDDVDRELLLERVWQTEWSGDAHVLSVHIANLRRKIDRAEGESQIKTIRGVGYRFAA
ncbi:Alkaline phosphatase synthesis transcriptional regulatory protein PhoP [Nymphon striatum]|nr:Alkaline phosphatase synthesis transcriptional regulatory protein PhoP [Nymphon striatum]